MLAAICCCWLVPIIPSEGICGSPRLVERMCVASIIENAIIFNAMIFCSRVCGHMLCFAVINEEFLPVSTSGEATIAGLSFFDIASGTFSAKSSQHIDTSIFAWTTLPGEIRHLRLSLMISDESFGSLVCLRLGLSLSLSIKIHLSFCRGSFAMSTKNGSIAFFVRSALSKTLLLHEPYISGTPSSNTLIVCATHRVSETFSMLLICAHRDS